MRTITTTTNFDFMGRRKFAVALSVVLLSVAVFSLVTRGLAFGIDFAGGHLIEVGYSDAADLTSIRAQLAAAGFEDAQVQFFGSSRDVLIRLAADAERAPDGAGVDDGQQSTDFGAIVLKTLQSANPGVELRRAEFVGPQVGQELVDQGGLAMLFALVMILLYVIWRFQWKFAVGAVAALVHDVVLTVGFFSVLQLDFDLSVLAAVLAVIGYSLNDTIVVFDRIRENFHDARKGTPVEIANASINQTLARTLITGITTLLVLIALFVLGGEVIQPFALALIVGVVVGTYSSIYTASATALALDVTPLDLMPPQEADPELDGLP